MYRLASLHVLTLQVVDGDIAKSKLGLSPQDYQEICENVTCIIHMAATTNFNENLRLAFEINVMGVSCSPVDHPLDIV